MSDVVVCRRRTISPLLAASPSAVSFHSRLTFATLTAATIPELLVVRRRLLNSLGPVPGAFFPRRSPSLLVARISADYTHPRRQAR